MRLYLIIFCHNAVAQVDDSVYHRPRRTSWIEHGITCVKQVGQALTMIDAHRIFQHGLIEQHLHEIVLARQYMTGHRELVGFARLHLYKRMHVTLHIVETALNAQRFADVRGFEYGIGLVQLIARLTESDIYRLLDIAKVLLTILGQFTFLGGILQGGTGRDADRMLAKSLHHTFLINGSIFVDPFVEEGIGNVTQNEGDGILGRGEPRHKVIGRMGAIVSIALSQRTGIQQIIGL